MSFDNESVACKQKEISGEIDKDKWGVNREPSHSTLANSFTDDTNGKNTRPYW